jgi:bacterioferritin
MENFEKNVKITAMDHKLLTDHPEIIDLLQKAYSNEYLAWLAYKHASKFIFGPWRESIIQHFNDHADEEEEHADWVGNRLAALGEAPALDTKIIKRAGQFNGDYVKIIEFVMQLEGEAVALYSKMLPLLESHAAMRAKIEEFVITEQEHFEDFEKMIRIIPEMAKVAIDQDQPPQEESQQQLEAPQAKLEAPKPQLEVTTKDE